MPGQLFFAVKGERLDGHDFVEQALDRGAAAAVVRKDQLGRYPVKKRVCWPWKTHWLRCRLWLPRCGGFGASR